MKNNISWKINYAEVSALLIIYLFLMDALIIWEYYLSNIILISINTALRQCIMGAVLAICVGLITWLWRYILVKYKYITVEEARGFPTLKVIIKK